MDQPAPAPTEPLRLGVNIDHVATLRQARYALHPGSHNEEPSLLAAAREAEAAGADFITLHLRQDRRHVQDRDVHEMHEGIRTFLNLEMGNTAEILEIALRTRPACVCLVPENRAEVTTEGGLDVAGAGPDLERTVSRLRDAGIEVSLFVDPDPRQIDASARLGVEMVELHTGSYANAAPEGGAAEFEALREAARLAAAAGLQVNAGHGLTMSNLPKLLSVPCLRDLNIGHHLVSRAVFVGLSSAVREMKTLMSCYPLPAGA